MCIRENFLFDFDTRVFVCLNVVRELNKIYIHVRMKLFKKKFLIYLLKLRYHIK